MSQIDHLESYLALLTIRRSAARRNVMVVGTLFAACALLGVAADAFWQPGGHALFLGTVLTILLALSLATVWARYEALNAILDLADELNSR